MSEERVAYDADKEQRIEGSIVRGEKRYKVTHVLGPVTDEAIEAFDRARDQRIRNLKGQSEVETSAFIAAVQLWDRLAVAVEGIGQPGEPPPADWKQKIAAVDKAAAINDGLLLVAVFDEEVQDAEDDDLLGWDEAGSSPGVQTVKLRCLAGNVEIVTSHQLAPANAQNYAAYNRIMSRASLAQGRRLGQAETRIPAKAKALGALYDELHVGDLGYAGRIPLHHKVAVVTHYLSNEQEIVTKN
jgi:hypothetical protein